MPYLATVNTPGYMPWDDDPPVFDTAQEAWNYLADHRTRAEDDAPCADCDRGADCDEYSETRETLAVLGTAAHWSHPDRDGLITFLASHGVAPNGTGAVHGDTPGYTGDHDLRLVYRVTEVEPE